MKNIVIILVLLCTAINSLAQSKRILFMMSAAQELPLMNGKTYSNTGVFLSEFYLAYNDLKQRGYEIDFTTPKGVPSKIDKESFNKKYWSGRDSLINQASQFIGTDSGFNHPMPLEDALNKVDLYAGIIVPGGQGLMVDLIKDTLAQKIITTFAEKQKCVGLICHAPALLTTFTTTNHPFKGYKVNSVTGIEEFFIENVVMKGKPYNRKIGKQLKRLGFIYLKSSPARNYAVRDRNLVTSQNPFSNEAFSKLFLEALNLYNK
ncbi:MAG: DJ-1/PfpI family protein [Bacteroidia bacterium]|jgi:putative intracellular protease/amidase|nr:DJ-1/PfpI family protein [Bacteroidia bacterium]